MSRQRFIYPEIWHSEQIMALSQGARLLFIGLFSTADDEGRRKSNALTLKADLMPLDDIEVETIIRWRDELAAAGLIKLYIGDRRTELLEIPTWHDYQKPRHTKASKFPAWPGSGEICITGKLPAHDGGSPAVDGKAPAPAGSGCGSGSGSGSGCGSAGVSDANASAPPLGDITTETAGLVRAWLTNGNDFRHVKDLCDRVAWADKTAPVWTLATCMEIQKANRVKDKAACMLRRLKPKEGQKIRRTPDKYMTAASQILNGPKGKRGQPQQIADILEARKA